MLGYRGFGTSAATAGPDPVDKDSQVPATHCAVEAKSRSLHSLFAQFSRSALSAAPVGRPVVVGPWGQASARIRPR